MPFVDLVNVYGQLGTSSSYSKLVILEKET
jgi:hypothetical protein